MNTTPAAQLLLLDAHEAMKAAVETETYDTPQRAYRRMEVIFGLYDDEEGEPDQVIRDLLTDVMHEAVRRGVSLIGAFNRAEDMHYSERRDWGLEREVPAG